MSDGVFYPEGKRLAGEHAAMTAVLIPQQMDIALYRDNCSHPDKNTVAVFAHGVFPTEDPEKQLILLSWLERHEKAFNSESPPAVECFGLDVARSMDGDATVLAAGGKDGFRPVHRWKYNDTTYHVGETLKIAREKYGIDLRTGRNPVCVDMDGIGAGTGDQLRQLGVWVIEFRGNASSQVDPRTYRNMRTEAYATLGRRLNPDDRWRDSPWAMPVDENLRQELTAPEKVYDADALRFLITPKNRSSDHPEVVSVKDKIGRSPDVADAVVYLFHAVRTYHNLNEWFQFNAARPLLVYPAPHESQAIPPAPDKTAPPEPDILRYYREKSGGLVGRDFQDPAKLREFQERYKRDVAQPPPTEDTKHEPVESWINRVRWSEDS